ncbi:MAG TPA: helix-turn-helix domain-containing protein [Dokdonella sp.]
MQRPPPSRARSGSNRLVRRAAAAPAAPAASAAPDDDAGLLAAIGVDATEERVYRMLLGQRRTSAEDVAHVLETTPRRAQRLLESLEAKGLATHSPERPRRYIAASPDIAIDALVRTRQERLERVRQAIPRFGQPPAADGDEQEQIVELITNRTALAQTFAHLVQTAAHEIVCLQRPPVMFNSIERADPLQEQARAKGVRSRAIADAEFLEVPGALNRIRLDVEAGEEIRVFPHLPFKMIIIDRRVGLIALSVERSDGPSLLLRSSALLDALYSLFEILWRRATPIALTRSGTLNHGDGARAAPAAERMIPLLAAGLSDKAIAHELGISAATLGRRIAELMTSLDARSRFQLGWQAALKTRPTHGD